MEKYNYYTAVRLDLMNMFLDRNRHGEWDLYFNDHDELKRQIQMEAEGDIYVTGDDYYGYKPEFATDQDKAEWLKDNEELLEEAKMYFDVTEELEEIYKDDYNFWDSTIRHYVLPEAMNYFIKELEENEYI